MNEKPNKTEAKYLERFKKHQVFPFVDSETRVDWAFVEGFRAATQLAKEKVERKAKRGAKR